MELLELEIAPPSWNDYCGKFVKIKDDTFGVYFVRSDGSCDYISEELFDIINIPMEYKPTKDKPVKNGYLETLIALSGKYTSDDIIKFKKEGMI
jgi:hypothetical protein